MNVGEAMAGNVGVDVGTASPEKRTYAVAVSWRQDRESPDSRSAQYAHEDRFRSVVGVMPRCNAVGSDSNRGLAQGSPARFTSASF